MQQLAMALRWAIQQEASNSGMQDLTAFVIMALSEINASVARTAEAWEKRGYWLKADRFVHQWSWVSRAKHDLDTALSEADVAGIAQAFARLAPHLAQVASPRRLPSEPPWEGAWQVWKTKRLKESEAGER